MIRAAVVVVDSIICRFYVKFLTTRGYATQGFTSTEAFYPVAAKERFDLVILDILLQEDSGLAVARWLRSHTPRTGILMLTGLDAPEDLIAGLNAGADAYLPQSSPLSVIDATCQSILRRTKLRTEGDTEAKDSRKVWRLDSIRSVLYTPDNRRVDLTHAETLFLSALFACPGTEVTRQELLLRLGKRLTLSNIRNLDSLVRRIHSKVQTQYQGKFPVKARYGVGYLFAAEGNLVR